MPPASARKPTAQIRAHLLDLLAPVVAAAGYDLEDVAVTAAGRRSIIRVIVDADGGIDLDAVATLSRSLSTVLDDDGVDGPDFAEPYVLEVSSPGVDRPLIEQRHWRRAVGRLVEVSVGGTPLVGRVVGVDGSGVTFEVTGVKGRPATQRIVAWSDLGRGKVQVEFQRKGATDPGEDADEDLDALDDELDDDELDDDALEED